MDVCFKGNPMVMFARSTLEGIFFINGTMSVSSANNTKVSLSSASVLLANAAKIKRGSPTPNKQIVGSVTKAQLEEIAQTKLPDLNTTKISSAIKIVEGTARNMGITITD